jgi:AcrR family transcriptional regulator
MRTETLTRHAIVKAAIDLLDDEGLEGLNMRALGKRLGTAPTAVYWHVGSKRELVTLAGDQVWAEIALPSLSDTDWRTGAASMATDFHAMLARHPWLVQAFGSYVVYGPGKSRHDDHSFAIYEAAGFTGADVERAATTVLTFVLGSALGPAAEASLRREIARDGRDSDELMHDSVAKATEIAKRFPRLRAHLVSASASPDGATPEHTFEFGLEAVLDGLEARLRLLHTP